MKKSFFLSAALAVCVSVLAQESDTLTLLMTEMPDIEVLAERVQQTASNHQVVSQESLNRDNTGQNLPYLLLTIPGLQVTSDDGLGIGYSYFHKDDLE